jgi:hypothetical protein
MVTGMELSLRKFNEPQKDWSEQATSALRHNLCGFPAMFAKCVLIGAASEFHTATATLVDLGLGPLAVTCAHVITDYLELWGAGRTLIRIGNIRVSPSQLADRELVEQAIERFAENGVGDVKM